MATGFQIITPDQQKIRFAYYNDAAPLTVAAFHATLPFERKLFHARVSGNEIWTDAAPPLLVPQENATVFTLPGEAVIGPIQPVRNKTAGCMGIYYGEGKGLDACNVFAAVFEEDKDQLRAFGEKIWKEGAVAIRFSAL